MDAADLWQSTVDHLRGQVSERAYAMHFAYAHPLSLENDELVLSVPALSKEWLEVRFSTIVQESLEFAAGHPVQVRYVACGIDVPDSPRTAMTSAATTKLAPPGPPLLQGTLHYEDRREAIVRPDSVALVTHYFRKHWVPLLGPTLAWIVVDLQQRAYSNPKTGEHRLSFECTFKDIAENIGISDDIVYRALRRPCVPACPQSPHPIIEHFVMTSEPVYGVRSHKWVRMKTKFRVLPWPKIPPTPADEAALQLELNMEPSNRAGADRS